MMRERTCWNCSAAKLVAVRSRASRCDIFHDISKNRLLGEPIHHIDIKIRLILVRWPLGTYHVEFSNLGMLKCNALQAIDSTG
jgi:hypothetical protein